MLVFYVVVNCVDHFDKKKQKPPTPLLFTDNIKTERIPTKLNKKYMPFLHCISLSFEGSNEQKGRTTSTFLL